MSFEQGPHAAQLRFAENVAAINDALAEIAKDRLSTAGMPAEMTGTISDWPHVFFKPVRQPGAIQGSDELIVKEVLPTDSLQTAASARDLLGRGIVVELFQDSSPWVVESDLERAPECQNSYSILAVPDTPPCMVNFDFIKAVGGNSYLVGGGRSLHEVEARFGAEALHWLSDSECTIAVTALRQAASYMDYESFLHFREEAFASHQAYVRALEIARQL